jgi:hypothetical protein
MSDCYSFLKEFSLVDKTSGVRAFEMPYIHRRWRLAIFTYFPPSKKGSNMPVSPTMINYSESSTQF